MSRLDFSVAITKHLAWKTRLRSFLDGKEALTEAQATSHRDCELGKWIYAEGLATYKHLPEMVTLEHIHQNLHHHVKEVVVSKGKNDLVHAESELKQVDEVSQQIVEILKSLDAKIR